MFRIKFIFFDSFFFKIISVVWFNCLIINIIDIWVIGVFNEIFYWIIVSWSIIILK